MSVKKMPKGLYIHIPFCSQMCTYCDFAKLFARMQDTDAYMDALIMELKYYEANTGFSDLMTIYIGGGTPTTLNRFQLEQLFGYLHQVIDFSRLSEVTIEANPEDVDDQKANLLASLGVNRVSIGVQTFDDKLLKNLGRTHTSESAIQAVKTLHTHGISNINLDLIYAIPGQSLAGLQKDLEIATLLGVSHISAYSLIVEPNTKLYLDYERDRISLVDNDLEATMYEMVIEALKQSGFSHYEISNFAKDQESVHNKIYWQNEEYIAVGLGSHGYIDGTRYHNTRSINAYLKRLQEGSIPVVESNVLSMDEKIEESMFLGLRLLMGVDIGHVNQRWNTDIEVLYADAISKLKQTGQIEIVDGFLRLTEAGLFLANDVFEEFLL